METQAKQLIKRIKKAKENKFKRENELQEAYKYTLPLRDTSHSSSTIERGVIFDSTAKNGLEKYATKLQNLLTPAWEEWLKLQPGSNIPKEEQAQAQEDLDAISDIAFSHIHHSNFYTAEHEAFLDLGISTGAIIVERNSRENEPSILNHRSIPLEQIIPEPSSRGSLDTIWREFEPRVKDITSLWPEAKVPEALIMKTEGEEDFKCKVYEGVVYNEKTSDYTMYVIEESQCIVMHEEQMNTSPIIAFRESVRPGDVLGFGRILRILEDIKTLNKMAENALRADGLNTLPIFTAVDDGAFNPYNVVLQPGSIIPVASNDNANPSLKALDVSNNYNMAENRMEQLRALINETLLANPYGAIDQTPVRSATEIAAREADLFQSTAAAFGRLQTEFLEKYMRRVVDILNQEGLLPDIDVNGREVAIKFTSPFSKMQGSEKTKNTMQWLSYISSLGPEVVQMAANLDKVPGNLAKNMGIDKELYKDATELDTQKEQLAQAAQEVAAQGGDLSQMMGEGMEQTPLQ